MNDQKIVMELPHFTTEELSCNCGCGLTGLTEHFAEKVEFAREHAGIPFRVRSARRCQKHNSAEGGTDNSEHIWGDALDIETMDGFTRWKVVKAALAAGIRRIGIGATFVHIGDGLQYKPYPVLWTYASSGQAAAEAEKEIG